MKKIIVFFAVILGAGAGFNQAHAERYVQLHPKMSMHGYNGVNFLDSLYGVVAADYGEVYFTSDGGYSWRKSKTSVNVHLRAAAMGSQTLAVAVGDSGKIVRTTDAGQSWATVLDIDTLDFTDVDMGSALNGIAVCGASYTGATAQKPSYALRTTDGGLNWSLALASTTSLGRFKYVSMPTPQRVVVTTENSRNIYSSPNSGVAWYSSTTGGALVGGICMTTDLIGYCTGQAGVYKTTDGGITWSQVYAAHDNFTVPSVCSAWGSLSVVAVLINGGSSGKLIASSDGGVTWEAVAFLTWVTDIAFRSPSGGIITYSNSQGIKRFSDFGSTLAFPQGGASTSLARVTKIGDSILIAGGYGGPLLRSTDDGKSWSYKEEIAGVSGIATVEEKVYITNNAYDPETQTWGSAVFLSNDSGASWDSLATFDQSLAGIAFSTPEIGVVVGYNGFMKRTLDGGTTWEDVSIPPGHVLDVSHAFIHDTSVFLALSHGTSSVNAVVLRSTDSGKNWRSIATNKDCFPSAPGSHSVTLNQFGTAAITYSMSTILLSHNAGLDWEQIDLPGKSSSNVGFSGENLKVVAGNNKFFYTTDTDMTGGLNFNQLIPSFPLTTVNSVMLETASTWYIVGDGGMVVRHEQGELVAPDTIDFGNVEINTTKDINVSLNNIGRDTLNIQYTIPGFPRFSSNSNGTAGKINPKGNTSFTVRFAPAESGKDSSKAIIVNNGILGNKTIMMKGTGVSKSICIDVPQTNLDFGDVAVRSDATLSFEIKSTCTDTLHVDLTLESGTTSTFSFTGPTSYAVPPGASFVINVSCAPIDTGLITDRIKITSDAFVNGTRYVDVRGVGREARLQITKVGGNPRKIDFKDTTVASSKDTVLYLFNSGNAALTINSIEIVDDIDSVFRFVYKPPTIPFDLLAAQKDSMKIRFMPKQVKTSNAKLVIVSTAPQINDTILLRGKGMQSIDIADALDGIDELFLYQNSPNPFSGQTQIHFQLPQNERKGIFTIHDMLGQEVYRKYLNTKTTNITFDARNLPNGVYMYSLSTARATLSKRMIITK